jgi:hypothetical protein
MGTGYWEYTMNNILALGALVLLLGGCAANRPEAQSSAAAAAAIMGYHGPIREEPAYGR